MIRNLYYNILRQYRRRLSPSGVPESIRIPVHSRGCKSVWSSFIFCLGRIFCHRQSLRSRYITELTDLSRTTTCRRSLYILNLHCKMRSSHPTHFDQNSSRSLSGRNNQRLICSSLYTLRQIQIYSERHVMGQRFPVQYNRNFYISS